LKIYLKSSSDEKLIYTFVGAIDKLFNGHLYFTWQHNPGAGNYTLRGVMTDKTGTVTEKDLDVVVQ